MVELLLVSPRVKRDAGPNPSGTQKRTPLRRAAKNTELCTNTSPRYECKREHRYHDGSSKVLPARVYQVAGVIHAPRSTALPSRVAPARGVIGMFSAVTSARP